MSSGGRGRAVRLAAGILLLVGLLGGPAGAASCLPGTACSWVEAAPGGTATPASATAAEVAAPEVGCAGDGPWTVRVYHAAPASGGSGRSVTEARADIRAAAAASQRWFRLRTGGVHAPRFATTADCELLVRSLDLPRASAAAAMEAVRAHHAPNRRHVVFLDGVEYPGLAGLAATPESGDPAGPENDNFVAVVYAQAWDGCTVNHELLHTLGAVRVDAPAGDGAGHTTAARDLMLPGHFAGVCSSLRLDSDGDAYFNTRPAAGGWLSANAAWNAARSPWLQRFIDAADHAHVEHIGAMAELGIVGGFPGGTFRPQRPVSRGQAASMLHRFVAEDPPVEPSARPPGFVDTAGHTHEIAIRRMAGLGVVQGFEDGTFGPEEAVTRAQFAALLRRLLADYVDLDTLGAPFPDTVGHRHEDAVRRVAGSGLVTGFADGTFGPNRHVTRGQAAVLLDRLHLVHGPQIPGRERDDGRPPNDDFTAATLLEGTNGQTTGTTVEATEERGEPHHTALGGGASVWYSWTAPASGPVRFSAGGSDFWSVLAVYTGERVDALSLVAESSGDPAVVSSLAEFDAVEGTTYRIAVDGYEGLTGQVVLGWLLAPAGS